MRSEEKKTSGGAWQKETIGSTPLMLAVISGCVDAAKLLIKKFGCNLMIKDLQDNSLLHLAVKYNCKQLVNFFVNETAIDPCQRNALGETPFSRANSMELKEISNILEKCQDNSQEKLEELINLIDEEKRREENRKKKASKRSKKRREETLEKISDEEDKNDEDKNSSENSDNKRIESSEIIISEESDKEQEYEEDHYYRPNYQRGYNPRRRQNYRRYGRYPYGYQKPRNYREYHKNYHYNEERDEPEMKEEIMTDIKREDKELLEENIDEYELLETPKIEDMEVKEIKSEIKVLIEIGRAHV